MTGIKDRATLKSYFENGDKPDETQFEELIDSSVGKIIVPTTYSGTLVTDLTKGHVFTITVTGDMEISNPTGGSMEIHTFGESSRTQQVDMRLLWVQNLNFLPVRQRLLDGQQPPGAMDVFVAQYDFISRCILCSLDDPRILK